MGAIEVGNNKHRFSSDVGNIERHISIMAHSIGIKCMLMDATKWEYFFYSDSFIRLLGYEKAELPLSVSEALRLIVATDNIESAIKEYNSTFDTLASLVQEKSSKSIVVNISCKLKTKIGILVNVDFVSHPLLFNDEGQPLVYLCLIKPSKLEKMQKIAIYLYDGYKRQVYLPLKEKFVPYDHIALKEEELAILQFATLGYNEQKMAKLLNQNITYIKYYKKRIFLKLNVGNITEAVYVALQSGILG